MPGIPIRIPIARINQFNQHRQKNIAMSFLMVEGPSDVQFYSNFVEEDHCKIVQAIPESEDLDTGYESVNEQRLEDTLNVDQLSAKEIVISTARLAKEMGLHGLFFIVDADYDNLDKLDQSLEGMLARTDYHDMETMAFISCAFFDLIKEHSDPRSIERVFGTQATIRQTILVSAYRIGCYRLFSIENELGISFKQLRYDLMLGNSIEITNDSILRGLLNKYSRPRLRYDQFCRFSIEMDNFCGQKNDGAMLQICQGHDIFSILYQYLLLHIGRLDSAIPQSRWKLERKILEMYAIDPNGFVNSSLFASMKVWDDDSRKLGYIFMGRKREDMIGVVNHFARQE